MALDLPRDLVVAARSGDREALDRLLKALWPIAFRTCYGITRNRAIAEDASQDALAVVCSTLSSLRDDAAVTGWFYRIVTRAARQALRRERRPLPTAVDNFGAAPTDRIDLLRALDRLTLAQREVVVLHYYADLAAAEIARSLGVPSATIRFRLMTARRAMRVVLSDPATTTDGVPTHVR